MRIKLLIMEISNNSFFCLLPNVIPVRGYNRSSILDLYAKKIHLIPNSMFDFLDENDFISNPIIEIMDAYGEAKNIISEYCTFLIEKNLAFFADKHDVNQIGKFPIHWYPESKIESVIIEIDKESSWNIPYFIERINFLGTKFLEIRFLDYLSFEKNIETIKDALITHSVESVDIYIPYNLDKVDQLEVFVKDFTRLNKLIVYNSNQGFEFKNFKINIIFSRQESIESNHCGNISKSNYTINTPSYAKMRNQNSCLAHKLSVSKKGEVKNCPSFTKSFGFVDSVRIDEVIKEFEFKKYWDYTKDKISICSDCEFRWVCPDCRAHTRNGDELGKPSKCDYNPYIGLWSTDSGYKTEEECGVFVENGSVVINEEQLAEINLGIWGE